MSKRGWIATWVGVLLLLMVAAAGESLSRNPRRSSSGKDSAMLDRPKNSGSSSRRRLGHERDEGAGAGRSGERRRRIGTGDGGVEEESSFLRRAKRRRTDGKANSAEAEVKEELPESMNVTVVTWNLGEASPSETDMTLLKANGFNESDLVVLGVQEVENLKPRRHEGSRSREWRRLTRKVLGRTHILLSHTTLGGLHQAIYVRKAFSQHVDRQSLHSSDVPCGVGNILHNKGGQATLLRIHGISFLFVNVHLAAHQHKTEFRNGDVDRILSELQSSMYYHLKKPGKRTGISTGSNGFPPNALVEKVDHVFFLGDLNYRLELPREQVEYLLKQVRKRRMGMEEAAERLLEYDQLEVERAKGRVFKGFKEGKITFHPTFKVPGPAPRYLPIVSSQQQRRRQMCKWYCMSEGLGTNVACLHCGTTYCQACLHGDAGKMSSLIKCASCGKKPRMRTAYGGKPNELSNKLHTKAQLEKTIFSQFGVSSADRVGGVRVQALGF